MKNDSKNGKKQTWPDRILAAVATGKGKLEDLDRLPDANPDSIRWYACKLVQAGKLRRVKQGEYALPAKRSAKPKAAK